MVIADPSPEFDSNFFGPDDLIFNPADQRHTTWSPQSEV